MTPEDPKSNVVSFQKKKREGTLVPVRARYDACKHASVLVEEGKREISCQKCGASLDAFSVLLEMAHRQRRWLEELDEWDARRESLLSERYDEQWAKDREGISVPPSDPSLRKIWDVFHLYFGEKFCGMYSRKARKRTGPEWYGKSVYGATVSLEYARHCQVSKAKAGGAE